MKIRLSRLNDAVHFQAVNEDGVAVQMDGAPAIGGEGNGARPMELLIMALGGCSGIDISLILKKQRLTMSHFDVEIDAEREQGKEPALFENIHAKFIVEGEIPVEKMNRAVELSMTKYCSVAKTLEKSANITYEVWLNNEKISD